jgi:hypothetical protein
VQYALDRLVKIHFEKAGMVMPRQAVQIYKDEGDAGGGGTLPVVGPVR